MCTNGYKGPQNNFMNELSFKNRHVLNLSNILTFRSPIVFLYQYEQHLSFTF